MLNWFKENNTSRSSFENFAKNQDCLTQKCEWLKIAQTAYSTAISAHILITKAPCTSNSAAFVPLEDKSSDFFQGFSWPIFTKLTLESYSLS